MDAKIVVKEAQKEFQASIDEDNGDITLNIADLKEILNTMMNCPYKQVILHLTDNCLAALRKEDKKIIRTVNGVIDNQKIKFPLNQLNAIFVITSHFKANIIAENLQICFWEHFLEDKAKRQRQAEEAAKKKPVQN